MRSLRGDMVPVDAFETGRIGGVGGADRVCATFGRLRGGGAGRGDDCGYGFKEPVLRPAPEPG